MVSIAEAREIILNQVAPLPVEEVPLLQAAGRVIAVDVCAPTDIPPADNSAMDGYAFAFASWQNGPLRMAGMLPAGQERHIPVAAGDAVRIMTGAPVPDGCDTVVPIEETVADGDVIRITGTVAPGSHIRRRGEEIRSGERAIAAGTLLRPPEIGLLAALDMAVVPVFRRPRVAILATGDELREPGTSLHPGRIVNSNSYGIAAQVLEAGAEPLLLGIAADTEEETREMICSGLAADLLITTGGVSVGDRDYVKESIGKLGGEILFWKVEMKPGKPVACAVIDGTPLLALPGNPVAAMVACELFVRPALLRMGGHRRIFRSREPAVLAEPVRNRGLRPHLIRVHVELCDGVYSATTTGDQGSARLTSLTTGNALLHCLPGTSLPAGAAVEVCLTDRGAAEGEETPWP